MPDLSTLVRACCAGLTLAAAAVGAPSPQVLPPPVVPAVPVATPVAPKSIVYSAWEGGSIQDFRSSPEAERRMVDRLVLAVTGQTDLGKAWQSLVRPDDRIGIKVSTSGGPVFSTHTGIVAAIIAGLEQAGIPRSAITVWDRQNNSLRAAGFNDSRGYTVRSVDPPHGFDPEVKFTAPMLGSLIWGDLSFRGQVSPLLRTPAPEAQISSESHLARLVTREFTRLISVPVLCEERGCGVTGALYNVTVPAVDNGRRFTQESGTSSICDLFADPHIGPKVTLTIVDGLLAQYAGGPEFNPNYSLHHRTLYASRDPVALDATLVRKLDGWRKEARLPPIGEHANWLREAQTVGLGNYEADHISIVPVGPPSP